MGRYSQRDSKGRYATWWNAKISTPGLILFALLVVLVVLASRG